MSINWSRRKYTEQEFVDAWQAALSVAQVANKLGCNKTGGGYYTLNETAKELGLTKDHMTGSAWNQGERYTNFNPPKPLSEVLVYGKIISTNSLKKRLYNTNLLVRKCSRCGITKWQEEEAPLALDHIDGDRLNNTIGNLRILCYNCHGLTKTFGNKKDNRV